jgi:polygalacturonase
MSKLLKVGRLLLGIAFFQSTAHGLEVVVAYPSNSADCTANLQAAFNGTADIIRIPNVGSAWGTGPLFIQRDNVTLILEPGVELVANEGAFQTNGRSLLTLRSCQNIVIRGYGATLRMRAEVATEYRIFKNHHALELLAVNNLLVEGLTITKAGTDGIFISGGIITTEAKFSSNVTIRDCDMDGNSRQGISVISAQDLLVERCVMRNTGVFFRDNPCAGIDFEPDRADQRLVRCTMRDCEFYNNSGPLDDNGSEYAGYGNGILTATLNLRELPKTQNYFIIN